jgi:hypothetical protein
MRARLVSWPKIIAVVVGGWGLAGVFGAFGTTFFGSGTWISVDWRALSVAALLLAASYPLATGREWARHTLFVAVATVGATMAVWYCVRIVSPMSFSDLTPEQVKVVRQSMRLEDISTLCLILSSFSFGLCFLRHPDVVTTFKRTADRKA